jgi:hypothetical protein
LKEEERHHQQLQDVGTADVAKRFHHRIVRPAPAANIKWLAMLSARKIMT